MIVSPSSCAEVAARATEVFLHSQTTATCSQHAARWFPLRAVLADVGNGQERPSGPRSGSQEPPKAKPVAPSKSQAELQSLTSEACPSAVAPAATGSEAATVRQVSATQLQGARERQQAPVQAACGGENDDFRPWGNVRLFAPCARRCACCLRRGRHMSLRGPQLCAEVRSRAGKPHASQQQALPPAPNASCADVVSGPPMLMWPNVHLIRQDSAEHYL